MRDKSQKYTEEYNYDKIRNQVAQNIAEGVQQDVVAKPRKKLALWKRIMLVATYTLLVCAIACGCTLGVQRAYASENYKIVYVNGASVPDRGVNGGGAIGDSANGTADILEYPPVTKRSEYIEKFDRFISFGRMTATELMRSYLLSEADKDLINHTVEHYKQVMGTDFAGGVFLGEIDGEDYVYIALDDPLWSRMGYFDHTSFFGRLELLGCAKCKAAFPKLYKCDLEYSLNDVLSAFEKMIGEPLTDEFLCELPKSLMLGNSSASGGIQIAFCENGYHGAEGKNRDKYQYKTETMLFTFNGDYSNAEVVQKIGSDGSIRFEISSGYPKHTHFATEIISIGEDGLVYTGERTLLSSFCEIYYVLYNNQLYVIDRTYMLTGEMTY